MRYFLELQYKGTRYNGWQIQQNALSIQEIVNDALSVLLKAKTETVGCGRTDTGVHALQFFAHFNTAQEIANAEKFIFSMNGLLPYDICILDLHNAEDDAHARFDATCRTYHYFIYQSKNPFLKDAAFFFPKHLNIYAMNDACTVLKTYNDFSCFSKSNTQTKSNVCKISFAQWHRENDLLVFKITADRFLRGMVRAIVGTTLWVGEKLISLNEFEDIIKNGDRKNSGQSVDACGLYLTEITYPFITSVKKISFALPKL